MLIALRDYLKEMKQASLKDVALHFDIPEGAAQGMLEYWISKGRVQSINDIGPACVQHACGGCHNNCCEATTAVNLTYRWVE